MTTLASHAESSVTVMGTTTLTRIGVIPIVKVIDEQ
jgi:hypothetical protein